MKKELVAIALILLSFSTGMILTAATSGCDAQRLSPVRPALGEQLQPVAPPTDAAL